MLLLFTFEEPSSGSRTTENRPRPTSWTAPISSEATWDTSLDAFSASTKRSFIQTSSSSCCSPYTFRVAAGSRRIGSSPRIRVTSPAMCASNRDRSRSTFAACSASVTSVPRPSSVLDVPSVEVVLDLLLAAVEVPPRAGVAVGEVREDLEVLHALAVDVGHLGLERLLAEGVLPDRAAREEAGGPTLASDLDEPAERVRIEEDQELGGARAEALHLLHGPAVEERREPPVPFLLVPGGLHRDEQAGPPREGEPIDRRPDAELRVEEVTARVGSQ